MKTSLKPLKDLIIGAKPRSKKWRKAVKDLELKFIENEKGTLIRAEGDEQAAKALMEVLATVVNILREMQDERIS